MPTVNGALQDDAVTHGVYLTRYQSHLVNETVKNLNRLDRELRKRLLDLETAGTMTRRQQRNILQQMIKAEARGAETYLKELEAELKLFSTQEGMWQSRTIEDVISNEAGKDIKPVYVDGERVWKVAESRPITFAGQYGGTRSLKGAMQTIHETRKKIIEGTIREGFTLGKTIQEMERDLFGSPELNFENGRFKASRTAASRIVRTTTNHVSTASRIATYRENHHLINGYEWVSTLDTRTSSICRWLDGKIWTYGEPAASTLDFERYPPAHHNCRSTTTPIIKSWRELGFARNQTSKRFRASMDGQVPADLSYNKWLRRQPKKRQIDVLGPTRYNLWKSGEIKLEQFAPDGRMLTLKQLRDIHNLQPRG